MGRLVPKFLTAIATSACLFGAACLAPAISQAMPCDGVGAEQPFLEWHDQARYVLVSGGDFESAAAGWTLSGGATVASGGNTLRPTSSASSLSLPAGAAATTPATCVGKGDPVARIFMRKLTTGKRASALGVEILYLDATGEVRKVKKAGKLHASDEWTPSRRFSLAIGQVKHSAKPKPRGSGEIQLRFTALTGSAWQIDDVFVDPSARR
jgi:hypothetical protein